MRRCVTAEEGAGHPYRCLTGLLHWRQGKGGDGMLGDITGSAGVVVVLILCVLTILVLAVFNLFQLSRIREMRDDVRELRYYVVQLARRANINLEEVAAPKRRQMPMMDWGYWREEQDADYVFPGQGQNRRWPYNR